MSGESRTERARRLGRLSLQVLREDRRLMAFPLVAALFNLCVGGLSFAVASNLFSGSGDSRRLILIGGLIASYPATFVSMVSGVALASVLARKLEGEQFTASEGWRAARERLGIIAGWTLLVCTVGAILRLLEEYVPLGGKIAAFLLDISWTLATLFAVPVLAYEGLGPIAAFRRSAELFRERWGEQILGVVSITAFGAFAAIPFVVLIAMGAVGGGVAGMIMIGIGGAGLLALQAFTIALNQVYRVFLYRSAMGQGLPAGPFAQADLDNPFHPRRSWWTSRA